MSLSQPRRGYRYSIEPFLLAAFCRPRVRERIVDLGAGVGIVGLLLARRHPSAQVIAVELQSDLAAHAARNARANALADRCRTIQADLRDAPRCFPPEYFHRAVANPPFRRTAAGALSADIGRANARQELTLTLAELVPAAAALLRFGGSLDMIHLAERLPELCGLLATSGFAPKRLRFIVPSAQSHPRLCLLSAIKGARPGLHVLPQLVLHERPGRYTDEVAAMLDACPDRHFRDKKRQPGQ